MSRTAQYQPEPHEVPFPFDFEPAYRVLGSSAVAWRITGYEFEPDEDTEWSGYQIATGRLIGHMIGDDRDETFDVDDLEPISDEDFCRGCGQIGCGCEVWS